MKMRERACWYAASRSSSVSRRLERLCRLPASDGSPSDRSASSPALEPAVEEPRPLMRSRDDRRMMLNLGCTTDSTGTSSESRRGGLQKLRQNRRNHNDELSHM
jgi:hypothetical protein